MQYSETLTSLLLTFSALLVLPAAKMRLPRCAAALIVLPWTIALLTGALCAPKPLDSNCLELELLPANSTLEPDGYFLPDGTQCYTNVPDKCKEYARENPRACSERRLSADQIAPTEFIINFIFQMVKTIPERIRFYNSIPECSSRTRFATGEVCRCTDSEMKIRGRYIFCKGSTETSTSACTTLPIEPDPQFVIKKIAGYPVAACSTWDRWREFLDP